MRDPVPQILLLAGRRQRILDTLAENAGVSHKCLAPVAGEAMIGRVLRTLEEAFPQARIHVSIDRCDELDKEPTVRRLARAGRITCLQAQGNIMESIQQGAQSTGYPLLITTADNVLVTRQALHSLASAGSSGEGDAITVLARQEDIRTAHPNARSTCYKFRDGSFANCNLFWVNNDKALKASEAFRHGGQFIKVPGRLLKTFGILNLIRFALGVYTLEQAMNFASQRLGVFIRPLVLSDGRLAIDVDNEHSLRMAEDLIAQQAA